MTDRDRLERLLAAAIAACERGGEQALHEFVRRHPEERARLLRGIERCREMGLLDPAVKHMPRSRREQA